MDCRPRRRLPRSGPSTNFAASAQARRERLQCSWLWWDCSSRHRGHHRRHGHILEMLEGSAQLEEEGVYSPFPLPWWWLCADDGHKIPMHSQSPPVISSPTENLLVVPRPLGQTGGDSLVVTVELLVQPSQSSLPRPQLPPPVRSRPPLQLPPTPPTRSWTLPIMASNSIARPSSALSRVSISRAAHE